MKVIDIRAGEAALATIREHGLRQEQVRAVAGAAGGPKWLVLYHFDRHLFGNWFIGREAPLYLVGSSIGAWRFAAAASPDPVSAVDTFRKYYIRQTYDHKPSADEVSSKSAAILERFFTQDALWHPYARLHILAVGSRFPLHTDRLAGLALGLGTAAFLNLFNRRFLRLFFRRTCFYDHRNPAPFLNDRRYGFQKVGLTPANLKASLLASGSIPLVMSGVSDIEGARPGMYRDGGIVDYHLDLPFLGKEPGIVLYPHFSDRVIPGWLDKKLTWRQAHPENMKNVLLIRPSHDFVEKLPCRKISERTDFKTFFRRDGERMRYWNTVADRSRILAEAFFELVSSGRIRQAVKPLYGQK